MNPNQTNANALVVKHYDNTYRICVDLGAYVRANAPDEKARNKAHGVLASHSDMQYARDMLYSLYGAFDELSERSCYKAAGRDVPEHNKHTARADFYRDIAQWARACYDVVEEAPVIKDAEDDSDPYVKSPTTITTPLYGPRPPNDTPSPKDTSMETALDTLQCRLLMADFGKRRIDSAVALFKSVVLERPSGATVLDVLERFGDEASVLSSCDEHGYGSASFFWDACVQISDDLRSDLAADMIRKASTVTVPEPDAVLWEVAGDPNRALYRTKLEARYAALKLFPDETPARRDMRLQSLTIKP